MFSKIEHLKNNRFARNFMKLFSATLLAQAITVLLSPVLTRLYTPEEFGYYGLYMAIVSLLVVYTTGRYEFAISTTKNEAESKTLLHLVILLSLISCIVIYIPIVLFKEFLAKFIGLNDDSEILLYIPITILVLGIMQGFNYYFNRKKDFSSISTAKITQSIGTGATSIAFATSGFTNIGMILGNITGIVLSLVTNLFIKKEFSQLNIFKYKYREIVEKAKEHKNYPIWNSTSAFFDVLALQAPVIILGKFFSGAIVGYFSLTTRVVALPITIISTAVAQVYLSELSENQAKGESIYPTVIKAAKMLSLLGLIPFVILVFFAPSLFSFFFGENWREAGELARILAFSYYAKFIVSPLSVVFFVKGAIKRLSIIQFSRAVTTLIVLIGASVFFESVNYVIISYVLYECSFYFIYWVNIKKIL